MNDLIPTLSAEQIALIKSTVAKGCSDNELKLFLHACQKTGLDPLMKQIYAVKRGGGMAIQTGIDGFRLIAERSGKYAPGREPSFKYVGDDDFGGQLISATAYIKKQTEDGTWHEVAATARFEEYCPGGSFWQKMPHVMIAKVAEALALRRAFPMELSGVYSTEEMTQADLEQEGRDKFKKLTPQIPIAPVSGASFAAIREMVAPASPTLGGGPQGTDADPGLVVKPSDPPAVTISAAKKRSLEAAIQEYAEAWGIEAKQYREAVKRKMAEDLGVEHFADLDPAQYEQVMRWINAAWTKRKEQA